MIAQEQLIAKIRDLALEFPDFAYDGGPLGCTYRPNANNHRGCIVGEALVLLGVPAEVLERVDLAGQADAPVAWGTVGPLTLLADWVEQEALRDGWIQQVQLSQDCGQPWSYAVETADDRVGQAPA